MEGERAGFKVIYAIHTMEAVHVLPKTFQDLLSDTFLGPTKLLLFVKKCLVYVWSN
jgi:hypothetical protein